MHDITIVGGGIVGMTLACMLAQRLPLSIALLEARAEADEWLPEKYHHRVSAISLASARLFNAIGIWEIIKSKRISPFTHIHVWDEVGNGKIDFDSCDISEPILGYIIENNAIQIALQEKLKQYANINYIAPVELQELQVTPDYVAVSAGENIIKSKLVIAADGANSWLRQQAGIKVDRQDYEQKAIVATVKTEFPHHQNAQQVFLASGPLAFLPLADAHSSSIVWSVPTEQATELMTLNDEEFNEKLAQAFNHKLGRILAIEKRFAFPLQMQQSQKYVQSRLALVGDAAHIIHPLAGQGVNIGLLDAASLLDVIYDAYAKQRDFSHLSTLRRYERWRKADNAGLLYGVDAIKRLFASDKTTIQAIRSQGLSLTDSVPLLKNIFIRHAVGNRDGLPSLAK